MKKNEIKWLSVLQGFCMLTVIIGHVYDKNNLFEWGNVERNLQTWIYTFHMPLFMFISGYLFNLTKISCKKDYNSVVQDKAKKLLIPYFSLNIITFFLKLIFPKFMKRNVSLGVTQFVDAFITLKNIPLYEMWFVNVLFGIMLLFPLFKKVLKNNYSVILFTFFCLFLHFSPLHFSFIFSFSKIFTYIFYFWFGIVVYQFRRAILAIFLRYIKYIFILETLLFFFAEFFYFKYPCEITLFLSAFLGIAFFVMSFYIVGKKKETLFISFRDYTYQIFLMGIFFQVAVRIIIFHFLSRNIFTTILLYVVSIAVGIYIPVVVSKLLQKMDVWIINLLFGLPNNK